MVLEHSLMRDDLSSFYVPEYVEEMLHDSVLQSYKSCIGKLTTSVVQFSFADHSPLHNLESDNQDCFLDRKMLQPSLTPQGKSRLWIS